VGVRGPGAARFPLRPRRWPGAAAGSPFPEGQGADCCAGAVLIVSESAELSGVVETCMVESGYPFSVVGVPAMRRQCPLHQTETRGTWARYCSGARCSGRLLAAVSRPSLRLGTGVVTALARCSGVLGEHTKDVVTRVGRDHPLPVTEIDRGTVSGRDIGPHYEALFALGGNFGGAAVGCGRLCDRPLCDTLHYRGLTAAGVSPIR